VDGHGSHGPVWTIARRESGRALPAAGTKAGRPGPVTGRTVRSGREMAVHHPTSLACRRADAAALATRQRQVCEHPLPTTFFVLTSEVIGASHWRTSEPSTITVWGAGPAPGVPRRRHGRHDRGEFLIEGHDGGSSVLRRRPHPERLSGDEDEKEVEIAYQS